MLSAVLFALSITAVSATIRPCTEVKGVPNFDMDALTRGIWFENARYPNPWEDNGDCTMVKFDRDGSGYTFFVSEVLEKSRKWSNASGIITLASNDKSAVIKFESSWYLASKGGREEITSIVDIDYDHYAIFVECKYNPATKEKSDHVWILSRAPNLEPQARKKLEAFFEKNKYLDMNKLIWDKFGVEDCTAMN